jgi:hypothetical protein
VPQNGTARPHSHLPGRINEPLLGDTRGERIDCRQDAVVGKPFQYFIVRSFCRSMRGRSDLGDLACHGLVPFLHCPGFSLGRQPASHLTGSNIDRAVAGRLAATPAGTLWLDPCSDFSPPCRSAWRSSTSFCPQHVSCCLALYFRILSSPAPCPGSIEISGGSNRGAADFILALVIGLWSNTRTGNLACRPHSANPGLKRTCGQLTRSPRRRGRGSMAGW